VFAEHRLSKAVSPDGVPIGIGAKRRKWPAILNPGRRDRISSYIR